MKLVQILAEEMEVWPEGVTHLTQSSFDREIYDALDGKPESSVVSLNPCFDTRRSHSEDVYPIVTRAQWQAERDRQKGGEWKRHRGGKCPVHGDQQVEVKLRDGDIQQSYARCFAWPYDSCDTYANIMQYRVISQPQAEEVEVINEQILKPAIDALEETVAQWHQIDGPLAWRDTIIHCQAIIEDCEREIERNVQLLDAEGLMMQKDSKKAMQHYAPDVDMSDWRNWQKGDIVEVILENDADIPVGERCSVVEVERPDYTDGMPVKVKDSRGEELWGEDDAYEGRLIFKFIRRP
jgi:hypothetical protein